MIVEADESDGSFLHLHPEVIVITNIDNDHLSFYENDQQKEIAKKVKEKFNRIYNNKIETNISPIKNYCKAEEYHQKYLEKN